MVDSTTSSDTADLVLTKDNTHNLIYFPFHGLAGCIRTTLILSGEPYKFTDVYLADWRALKQLTPFGHVPVLKEETRSGKVLELAEISAIESFLAKRSGLLGNDFWQESLIRMYHSSTHSLFTFLVHSIVQSPNEEDKRTFLKRFKESNLPSWIQAHEKHLKANGSNGHYVGDQLSIADIKTASVIEHLIYLCGNDVQISEEKTPAIMAVKAKLEKDPKYAEWRATEQYQTYTAKNIGFFGF
ncbi:hypothetical protein BX616_005051 [Lobosporangium transversale]|uniref:Glutathione S-transferase n=1 Tax=Lobosporangium transversale TaxID=64571 RepID=A0A1Y2H2A6_9FUNG|nr:glutathione S-transferase [Lobosporangium transversale]KAF9915927.1 hypothetical protein BX616_005051 [Lobosporangium transversale]ORZ28111.1 glutathione S-transferase [Lobosporangium transversale]|eukprot:XP_021885796.1 glutathione S-transferase [Lobosporangium transversale]